MSYFHCGNGYPDRCNGYKGPLDASVCTSGRHKYGENGRQIPEEDERPCLCGHDWERHGPDAGGCIECRCRATSS